MTESTSEELTIEIIDWWETRDPADLSLATFKMLLAAARRDIEAREIIANAWTILSDLDDGSVTRWKIGAWKNLVRNVPGAFDLDLPPAASAPASAMKRCPECDGTKGKWHEDREGNWNVEICGTCNGSGVAPPAVPVSVGEPCRKHFGHYCLTHDSLFMSGDRLCSKAMIAELAGRPDPTPGEIKQAAERFYAALNAERPAPTKPEPVSVVHVGDCAVNRWGVGPYCDCGAEKPTEPVSVGECSEIESSAEGRARGSCADRESTRPQGLAGTQAPPLDTPPAVPVSVGECEHKSVGWVGWATPERKLLCFACNREVESIGDEMGYRTKPTPTPDKPQESLKAEITKWRNRCAAALSCLPDDLKIGELQDAEREIAAAWNQQIKLDGAIIASLQAKLDRAVHSLSNLLCQIDNDPTGLDALYATNEAKATLSSLKG